MKLKNNLHVLRAEQKWTQQYVAEQLGVSRQTINSLEANKYNPSLILAFQIARLFGKEVTDIFSIEEEEK
ncbi:helix-turn-helix transcriptional regulator [Fictibacillus aquaticus]|uniref:Transcriptional regulator n=1 Tax=Fictibacillus aquaticus TaxID=2021314 RepID=A0A235FDI9_9BACL|nr:helix-turn-helix transcriptional regulator [Fictibacillus aquaticus]OYD59381.1 transcriptional regulator [Fictibacillus aquaticus]